MEICTNIEVTELRRYEGGDCRDHRVEGEKGRMGSGRGVCQHFARYLLIRWAQLPIGTDWRLVFFTPLDRQGVELEVRLWGGKLILR